MLGRPTPPEGSSSAPLTAPPLLDPPSDQLTPLVRQRELQKLDLEIAHLREPWWRRPAYLGLLLPVILGIATLGIGFWTGYVDTQRSLIEVRTEKLRLEEERLTERSDSLRSDFRRRQDSLAAVVTDERLSARREIARNDSFVRLSARKPLRKSCA
jgi:hypothetical protein